MYRRRRPLLVAGGAAVVLVLAAVVVFVVTRSNKPTPTVKAIGVESVRNIHIPVDGVSLSAEVITPKKSGKLPLVVMPAGWNSGATMYGQLALHLASSGFQVVTYAQRGFGGSTGKIDFAGKDTQRDARSVITWALAHTHSDASKIGMLGVSLGGGISLLTAAHDSRVRAVVALSTWTSFADALDQNSTASTLALGLIVGKDRTRYDTTVQSLQRALNDTGKQIEVGPMLRQMSPTRSPDTYVEDLNKNKPAIMIANAYEDSLVAPGPLVPFFKRLTTPKRLELAPGDHVSPERLGLAGQPDPTTDDAVAWLEHYLGGVDNGIDKEKPILLRDISAPDTHSFSTWPSATAADRRVLDAPPGASVKGGTWQSLLSTGVDSTATSGAPQLTVTDQSYAVPSISIGSVNSQLALMWQGPTVKDDTLVAGTPSLQLQIGSATTTATIYAYLYDVAPSGRATLFDMVPYTATGLTPKKSKAVSFDMQPTAYTVPSGDHVTLVIDTADPRYTPIPPKGTLIGIASSTKQPAVLTVPTSN